jgi:hypothetical protein
MPRPKSGALTHAEIQTFIARLNATVADAERFHELKRSLGRAFGTPERGRRAVDHAVATSAGAGTGKRGGRRRRRGNVALEKKIIDAVKGARGGLGSVELSAKLGVPTARIKPIAQRLKGKKVFKVVGVRRNAKYLFVG